MFLLIGRVSGAVESVDFILKLTWAPIRNQLPKITIKTIHKALKNQRFQKPYFSKTQIMAEYLKDPLSLQT